MLQTLLASTKLVKPIAFYHLLATLAYNGHLLQLYSQNINGIDTAIELLRTKVFLLKKALWLKTIQLYRYIRKIVCLKCYKVFNFQIKLFNRPI